MCVFGWSSAVVCDWLLGISGTLLLWVLITGLSFQRWRSSDFSWMLLSLQRERERELLHIDQPPRLASSPQCGLWADCKWSLNRGKFHASLHNPTEETMTSEFKALPTQTDWITLIMILLTARLYHLHTLAVMKYRIWCLFSIFWFRVTCDVFLTCLRDSPVNVSQFNPHMKTNGVF